MPPIATDYIICPFTTVIDTREQAPFSFRGIKSDAKQGGKPLIIKTTVKTLTSGDYSIEGFEDRLACERKSLPDLFQTLSHGRDRFERELARLNLMDFAAVVVEADWAAILQPNATYSAMRPKSIVRSVIAFQQRYVKVHWWMMPTRWTAEQVCFRVLDRFWQDRERDRDTDRK